VAISHQVSEQTSTVLEFAEQTAVATRHLYAAPNRLTTHRLVALDVPTPSWMRAPGETPGVYALECAMDELAERLGLDPVELRIRNEPGADPETGQPFSSRHLVECLRAGAARFGWDGRSPRPGRRRDGRWFVGTGVAASIYPARAQPSSARASVDEGGQWLVEIDAADIGTGARTALLAFAAERAGVAPEAVRLRIADSHLPPAMIAGGSMGTASWTWAIAGAVDGVREQIAGGVPPGGAQYESTTAAELEARPEVASFSFGAQFVEVRVDADTGEVRVPRLTGVFAAGRILSARTARSQLIGGMTMGVSMALFEEGVLDPAFGDIVNHDLAQYHVAANADIGTIDVTWLEEDEATLGPAGAKGIGEIGIVGTAAAVANAVRDATGIRVRDLPIRLDRLVTELPG
jgi:xanthine dehydrogenase YagR molybdenum-binding subunit